MKWLKYSFAFLVAVVFICIYIRGYNYGIGSDNSNIRLKETVAGSNPLINNDDVADVLNNVILSNAEYILEEYDLDSGRLSQTVLNLPVEFVGLERQEIVDFIENNYDFFKDKNEKVVSVMLLSFSNNRIVIRKTTEFKFDDDTKIDIEESIYEYFICLENDYLVVYKRDRETVFMNTGISVDMINDEDLGLVKQGIPVEDINTLYKYLESYTS